MRQLVRPDTQRLLRVGSKLNDIMWTKRRGCVLLEPNSPMQTRHTAVFISQLNNHHGTFSKKHWASFSVLGTTFILCPSQSSWLVEARLWFESSNKQDQLLSRLTQMTHEVRGDQLLEPGVIGPDQETIQHLGHLRQTRQRQWVSAVFSTHREKWRSQSKRNRWDI